MSEGKCFVTSGLATRLSVAATMMPVPFVPEPSYQQARLAVVLLVVFMPGRPVPLRLAAAPPAKTL